MNGINCGSLASAIFSSPSLSLLPAAVMGASAMGSAKERQTRRERREAKQREWNQQTQREWTMKWRQMRPEWNCEWIEFGWLNGAPSASAVSSSTHSSSLLPLREMKSWNEVEGELLANSNSLLSFINTKQRHLLLLKREKELSWMSKKLL